MKFKVFFCLGLILTSNLFAQSKVRFYLLNSFVTEDKPKELSISFITTRPSKTKILILGNGKFNVSKKLKLKHNFKMDLRGLKVKDNSLAYILIAETKKGVVSRSDTFYVEITDEQLKEINEGENILPLVYLGALTFLAPMPGIVKSNGVDNVVTLNKELPLISLGGSNRKYPLAVLSFEYSYLLNRNLKNLGSVGISFMQQIKYFEYFALGIALTSDFSNNYGVSPSIALGLFNVYNAFTVFIKYKYDYFKAGSINNYNEVKLGLYAKFFSINF